MFLASDLGRVFPTFGPVEEHPGGEVFGKVLESVTDSGGDEEDLSCFERLPNAFFNENAGAGDNDINLVTRVRLLRIHFVWSVNLDFQQPMAEKRNKLFASGLSQCR